MSEYIKREDAINALCRVEGCGNICRHNIERLPSADVVENVRLSPITTATEGKPIEYVEVVRCKYCKYSRVADMDDQEDGYLCSLLRGHEFFSYDYCSYGERRDDREYNNSILNARKGEE